MASQQRPSFGPGTVHGVPPPPPRPAAAVTVTATAAAQPVAPGRRVGWPAPSPAARVHVQAFGRRPFLEQSFAVGSVSRIPVRVHWMLPLLWLAQALLGLIGHGAFGFVLFLVLFGPLLWSAVLLHELCHCWAARAVGSHADSILLWPLGGLAFVGRAPSPAADLKVAAAGPASHVPQLVCFVALWALADAGGTPSAPWDAFGASLLWQAFLLHTQLLAFNLLLPVYPLDGGRILIDALLMRGLTADRAAYIAVRVSSALLAALIVFALWFTFTSVGGVVFLFVAAWMAIQVHGLHRLQQAGLAHLHPLFASASGGAEPASPPPVPIIQGVPVVQVGSAQQRA